MYTILLADDEQAILDTLQLEISWEQLGVDTILTAADGVTALQLMKDNPIDLLISDIRMPHMDGLELLSNVRELYPEVHCILLTAYGEFDYARKALQLGVENYLLKPFQQEEMEKTIEKALDNIYASRQNTKQLFRDNILSRWVSDDISSEELSERVNLLNVNIYLNTYCVLCIRKRISSHSVTDFCKNVEAGPEQNHEAYSFWDQKGRYVIILGGSQLTSEELAARFEETAQSSKYSNSFLIAVGPAVDSSEKVWQSYQTACSLLETCDLNVKSGVLTQKSSLPYANDALLGELRSLFQEKESDSREARYQQLAEALLHENTDMDSLLPHLAQALFQLFEQEFPNQSGPQKEVYSRIRLFSVSPAPHDLTAAIIELLEYSYLMFHYYFEQLSPVIQHAISYIRKNYAGSLSIKEFCAKSKMSTAYLGYLFKKETGMFFNNYLQQYRICCALQLLQDTELQINDIAERVGFSSTSYFISCFKKQVGLSPIKYRTLKLDI